MSVYSKGQAINEARFITRYQPKNTYGLITHAYITCMLEGQNCIACGEIVKLYSKVKFVKDKGMQHYFCSCIPSKTDI